MIEVDFGFSPELQAQIDAIPEMVRDENGDRDYPDSFYRSLHKDLNPIGSLQPSPVATTISPGLA